MISVALALALLSANPEETDLLPPSDVPRVITAFPLRMETYLALRLSGCNTDGPTDSLFISPPRCLIVEMNAYTKKHGHRNYIPEANDCEDIAREWVVLARRWAIENVSFTEPVSLTVFMVYAEMKNGAFNGKYDRSLEAQQNVYHAFGLIRDADGTLWFFDPQTEVLVRATSEIKAGFIRPFKVVW